ncbi:serine hydrolase [Streptomyces globosus]|uniref:serine hydrolase n=1 Tax=Streptomyces globosus TaxID=68209 RepID=UPI0031DC124C
MQPEPLTPFRASYAYTDFGLTAAAEAVARARGTTWQKLGEDVLFKPAGMTRTNTAFAAEPDRAATHVKNAGTYDSPYYGALTLTGAPAAARSSPSGAPSPAGSRAAVAWTR